MHVKTRRPNGVSPITTSKACRPNIWRPRETVSAAGYRGVRPFGYFCGSLRQSAAASDGWCGGGFWIQLLRYTRRKSNRKSDVLPVSSSRRPTSQLATNNTVLKLWCLPILVTVKVRYFKQEFQTCLPGQFLWTFASDHSHPILYIVSFWTSKNLTIPRLTKLAYSALRHQSIFNEQKLAGHTKTKNETKHTVQHNVTNLISPLVFKGAACQCERREMNGKRDVHGTLPEVI